ncbi:MAG: ABC transporter substrate-binding protein [Oscillospiraceae bacterium]|nr:ABC transporter substrate-binding protein [Oscillospiraceae bacterium]
MKLKLKGILILSVILIAALLLAACGNNDTSTTQETQPTQPGETQPQDTPPPPPTPGGERTGGEVVFVMMSEPPSLCPIGENDSASSDINAQLYEGLMRFTGAGDLVPLLAESYRPIENAAGEILTWEFTLRQGVYFHDGEYFNADAVKLSLDRALGFLDPQFTEEEEAAFDDEDNPDPRRSVPARFVIDMISEVEVVDTYTVRLHLEFPFTPILAHLTHQVAYIVSPAAIAEEEAGGRSVNENPVGTGAFSFDYRVHGDYLRLAANMDHWDGAPYVDSLLIRVIPETATRLAMINVGEGNALIAQTGDAPQISAMGDHITWWRIPTTTVNHVGFNTTRGPLQDARVRRALTMATPRQDILDVAAEGNGLLAVGPVGPNVMHTAANDLEALPFDLDAARALLEEAGYGDGFDLRIWWNYGNAGRGIMAEMMQHTFSQLGINVILEAIEWTTYLESTAAGEHDIFIMGWITMTGDADYGMFSLYHSSMHGSPGNRFFFSDDRVDALLEEGRMESDPARRDAIYREVTAILIEEAPAVWLFHPLQPVATNGIEGLDVNFNLTPFFHRVRLVD